MNILVFTYPINGLLMLGLPIVLAIILTRRFHSSWYLIWVGAAVFVFAQLGHIPFNLLLTALFQRGVLPTPPQEWQLLFNAVILGLSAGLWEQMGNYAAYRWWVKDARTWPQALLLGTGHGGIEAMILGGLVIYAFLRMLTLQDVDLSTIVPTEQLALAQAQVQAYWSTPWYLTLLGAVERASALTVQIACAVLVLQTFTRRKSFWLWMAVGLHAAMDASAVYAGQTLGPVLTELILAGFGLLALAIIFALRQLGPEMIATPALPALPKPLSLANMPEVEATSENLENTRYQ